MSGREELREALFGPCGYRPGWSTADHVDAVLALPQIAALLADAERIRRVQRLADSWGRVASSYSVMDERDKASEARQRIKELRRALDCNQ